MDQEEDAGEYLLFNAHLSRTPPIDMYFAALALILYCIVAAHARTTHRCMDVWPCLFDKAPACGQPPFRLLSTSFLSPHS